jgi:hypothetical protein
MSFPRSGNGWIRYLITEALLISKDIDLEGSERSTYKHNNITAHCIITKSGQSFGVEDFFPDYYAINTEDFQKNYIEQNHAILNNAYVKTHHLVFRKDVKIVHLYRNPKDVCISYFNLAYINNNLIAIDKNSTDFTNFFKQSIKIYLDVYFRMLRFYVDKANNNKNVLLLRMEDIVTNGEECFDNLLDFLQADISRKERVAILERNPKIESIKKTTKIELENLWDEDLDNYAENGMQYYLAEPLLKA